MLSALSLPFPHRACASSETESEAGDIMDQQFEEMNNRLNSVTDPTGFLRMVRRNNLFNRYVWPCLLGWCQAGRPGSVDSVLSGDAPSGCLGFWLGCESAGASVVLPGPRSPGPGHHSSPSG